MIEGRVRRMLKEERLLFKIRHRESIYRVIGGEDIMDSSPGT